MRKLLALMIAVVMCMAMTLTVYAAGDVNDPVPVDDPTDPQTPAEQTYTITITKDTTDKVAHTYGAYQIFAGKLETVDGKSVLSDITWGTGVNSTTLIEKLNEIDGFNIPDNADAAAVAKAIGDKNLTTDSEGAQAIADAVNAALTETQKSWATPGSISYENCKTDGTFAGAIARVSSRSLVLEETVKLKAYMTFDTAPGSNVKVVFRYTASSGQEKVTEVNSKDFVYDSAKNRYSAMLTTIAPPDFKKPISIKIYDGSTQISAEYTYSVESYAYSASQWEGSQYDTLKTLVSAMIKYSRAAETYFQQGQ